MKKPKGLSAEDRILWRSVAKSARPLKGKQLEADPVPEAEDFGAAFAAEMATSENKPAAAALVQPTGAPRKKAPPAQPGPIDRPTTNKIAKGRIAIEGKVDLHGLTQGEAHALLLDFLHQAHARDRRHVLVVTGKGASFGSEGVLKRAVPIWFATPPFRALVGGYREAAQHHGGTGALYVRLRRAERS